MTLNARYLKYLKIHLEIEIKMLFQGFINISMNLMLLGSTRKFDLRHFNFSGTKLFMIEMSLDQSKWTTAVSSSLHSVSGKSCKDIKEEKFEATYFGRYLRFKAIDFYGKGAGLQFISWKFNTEEYGELKSSQKICP